MSHTNVTRDRNNIILAFVSAFAGIMAAVPISVFISMGIVKATIGLPAAQQAYRSDYAQASAPPSVAYARGQLAGESNQLPPPAAEIIPTCAAPNSSQPTTPSVSPVPAPLPPAVAVGVAPSKKNVYRSQTYAPSADTKVDTKMVVTNNTTNNHVENVTNVNSTKTNNKIITVNSNNVQSYNKPTTITKTNTNIKADQSFNNDSYNRTTHTSNQSSTNKLTTITKNDSHDKTISNTKTKIENNTDIDIKGKHNKVTETDTSLAGSETTAKDLDLFESQSNTGQAKHE